MNEVKTNNPPEGQKDQPKSNCTENDRIKSSLKLGLIISGVWMLIAGGSWDLNYQMAGFVTTALFIFVVSSGFAFIAKTALYYSKKGKA